MNIKKLKNSTRRLLRKKNLIFLKPALLLAKQVQFLGLLLINKCYVLRLFWFLNKGYKLVIFFNLL
jgi:hypothetical protein